MPTWADGVVGPSAQSWGLDKPLLTAAVKVGAAPCGVRGGVRHCRGRAQVVGRGDTATIQLISKSGVRRGGRRLPRPPGRTGDAALPAGRR